MKNWGFFHRGHLVSVDTHVLSCGGFVVSKMAQLNRARIGAGIDAKLCCEHVSRTHAGALDRNHRFQSRAIVWLATGNTVSIEERALDTALWSPRSALPGFTRTSAVHRSVRASLRGSAGTRARVRLKRAD